MNVLDDLSASTLMAVIELEERGHLRIEFIDGEWKSLLTGDGEDYVHREMPELGRMSDMQRSLSELVNVLGGAR